MLHDRCFKNIFSFTILIAAGFALFPAAGCGDSGTEGDAGDDAADTGADQQDMDVAQEDAVGDDVAGEIPVDSGDEDAGETQDIEEEEVAVVPLTGISLPQAVDGAMWANPGVYTEIPLHISVEGTAGSVSVSVGEGDYEAADEDGDWDWVAMIPIDGLDDGFVDVEATAAAEGYEPRVATAQLGIGTRGVQLTVFDEVGFCGVPRIHRRGDEVWLTWTDRSSALAIADAYVRRIDGAARWQTERVSIVGDDDETLYARTALGTSSIGVLYQKHGGPYTTYFKIVDFDGEELMEPVELDPEGWFGSFGGDIAFDGSGFVAVWRVNNGAGGGEVRWMRVDESSYEVTGPIVAAEAGAGTPEDPIGGFEPFTTIGVEAIGDVSLVTFVRHYYHSLLAMTLPKSQAVSVQSDGTPGDNAYIAPASDYTTYHREARVSAVGDEFVLVWTAADLEDDDLPQLFYGAFADAGGTLDPDRGRGVIMLDEVDDRDNPFLLGHPDQDILGTLVWIDNRSYTLDPEHGGIVLYFAAVGNDLIVSNEVVFPHARFHSGMSQLNTVAAGTNVLILWLDERHGGGILDPKPEMWFETAWL